MIKRLFQKKKSLPPASNSTPRGAITVYGVKWCPDCRRSRAVFAETNVPYIWIDIDANKLGEKFVLAANRGNRSVPTIVFPDGSMLVEPDSAQLRKVLEAFKTDCPT